MNQHEIKELAARLEQAHTLSPGQQLQLRRDLQRYASRDLYGAAQLCRDHLSKSSDLRVPTVIQAAPLIAKHFEARMHEQRRAIDLHMEQDKQVRQPDPQREYVGTVVGITPGCVIQQDKETGDLIVHSRSSLVAAFQPTEKDRDLAIKYPQAAIGGVGIVSPVSTGIGLDKGVDHSLQHEHSKPAHAMELGR